MFKPTPSLQKTLRRLPLSTKQAGKEYYKGSGVGNLGTIDKFARFKPDFTKIRTYVFPQKGTKNFDLTPFVASQMPTNVQEGLRTWSAPPKGLSGEEYLARWKAEGGHDDVGDYTRNPEVFEEKTTTKS